MRALAILLAVLAVGHADARRPRPADRTTVADRQAAWQQHQRMSEDSLFRGLPWRCVGPIVQGGRLVDIEVDPRHAYTFYVAYASGGLWRTENNGLSFTPLTDQLPTIVLGDVALDPQNPDVIWIGTGENNSSRSSYGGLGLYRSSDAGATWEYRGLGASDRIGRIWIDPRDSQRIVVAALGALYTTGGERGIYLSENGGDSWQLVERGQGEWTGFVDLVPDPSDPNTLYAAAWERSRRPWNFVEGGTGSGIYKSTDAGSSWQRLDGGFPRGDDVGRIGLTLCESQPQTLYAYLDNQELLPEDQWILGDSAVNAKRLRSMTKEQFLRQDPEAIEDFIRGSDFHPEVTAEKLIEQVENDEITLQDLIDALTDANANLFDTDIRGAQVWRSDDAGVSWRITHDEPIRDLSYTYGYYFGQIRVSPKDPDTAYIMGVPILRTTDGGKSWHSVQDREVHVDYQAMWINPETPEHVMVGNDGGLAMSWDGGETWQVLNQNPVGQFYTISVDDETPYNIYGGLQDNGTYKGSSQSRPGISSPWRRINGGDGFHVQIDPRDGTTYAGFQFGYYTRIDPNGRRSRVRPRNHLKEPALRYNWSTPVLLSSHNQDIVYFGANMLFRSMDQGKSWTAVSEDLSRNPSRGDVPFGTITSVSESSEHFGRLWVGTDDGQLWLSEDGGHEWEDRSDGLPRDRWVSRVVASEHEADRVYVTLNGYRDDDMSAYVYRSEDLGQHWQTIHGGLPAEPVNVLREDPERDDTLYVGSDRGVYVSMDRGESWMSLDAGLPSAPVHDLAIQKRDADLVAGTHGRSAWVIDIGPLQKLDDEIRASDLHLFEPEEVQASRGWRGERSLWFYRPEDDDQLRLSYWDRTGGSLTIRVLDSDERLLREMTAEALPGINVFDWDLLLDEELALAAEEARLAAMEEPSDNLKDRPWSEALRLEWPLYVTGGDYTIELVRGETKTSASLEVKAPEKREPRDSAPATRPKRMGP